MQVSGTDNRIAGHMVLLEVAVIPRVITANGPISIELVTTGIGKASKKHIRPSDEMTFWNNIKKGSFAKIFNRIKQLLRRLAPVIN